MSLRRRYANRPSAANTPDPSSRDGTIYYARRGARLGTDEGRACLAQSNGHPLVVSSSARTAASKCASSGPRDAPSGACPRAGVEEGETFAEAALREVAEETGLLGDVEQELGSIDYSFYSREQGGRIHKTVHYFLVRATGGDTSQHDHEVSDAKWVRLRQALRLMTYPNEREMVRRAADALGRPVGD